MTEIVGSKILILGYGVEGKSARKFIKSKHSDKKIYIIRQVIVEKERVRNLENYDTIVRSPGISPQLPELQSFIKAGKKLTSATNLFFSECPGMIIGVTGTKGKSTTSSLIKAMLDRKFSDVRLVGNIGNPALDSLENSIKETIFVIELSSYQLADLHYSPHIAVVLAVFPEHLNYHGDFSTYVEVKANIVKYQNEEDLVFFNSENEESKKIASLSPAAKKIKVEARDLSLLDDASLISRGNLQNASMAQAVAMELGVAEEEIKKTLKSFKPLTHRLEFVGEFRGIRFFNDSLATIPEATVNALEALGDDVETLIAGGFDRGLDFSLLVRSLQKSKVKNLILFPTSGKKIWEAIGESKLKKFEVDSMEDAVKTAFAETPAGKICLLSPASPSFNLFQDYKERGELFKKLVTDEKS